MNDLQVPTTGDVIRTSTVIETHVVQPVVLVPVAAVVEEEYLGCWPTLSLKQRIVAWVVCCSIGWVLCIVACILLVANQTGGAFAILYAIGQVLNLLGSFLLASPKSQFRGMKMSKKRILAAVLYILFLVGTIVVACFPKIQGLVFLFLILQMLAYFWYMLSFIPFGLKKSKKCCVWLFS